MKKMMMILIAFTSTQVFASNPELDAIVKKYYSSLMNFKVGMKSVSKNEGTDIEVAEDGTVTTKISKDYVTSVLIKVDGTKVYEYEVTKDLSSGEETVTVNLVDHQYESSANSSISNIKVINNVLSGNFVGKNEDEFSSYEFKGSFTKKLLSPMFCDFTNNLAGNYTDLSSGRVYPMKDNRINKCDGVMSISDIKKIDLSEIEFCDYTLPDESGTTCETRDMSFLTSDL